MGRGRQRSQASSMMPPSTRPSSCHSRLFSVSFFTPPTRLAHKPSIGVRKVNALCELMTPMACRTAFRLSRPNTAGWLIHSRLDSSSASRAATVLASMPGVDPMVPRMRPSLDRLRGIAWDGNPLVADEVADAVGDGECFLSGVPRVVGEASETGCGVEGCDLLPGRGGTGGRPPFPRPLRMDRVSFRRV